MNSITVDSIQQRKFKVYMLFHFEAVDPSTKTVRELPTYAIHTYTVNAATCH